MRVYLTTLDRSVVPDERLPRGSNDGPFRRLRACAAVDRFGVHTLAASPEEADLILFAVTETMAGAMARPLRRHPLVRRYRERAFVYNVTPSPIPFLPGVYPSIELRDQDSQRTRSGHYLQGQFPPLPEIAVPRRDLLYSFVGSTRSAPVRARILRLRDDAACLTDVTDEGQRTSMADVRTAADFMTPYATVLARSQFALCPRGFGASSIRLFESMRAGCAPVIIADQWTPPTGPDWSRFSLRVPESAVSDIPDLLRSVASHGEEMGALARAAWEEWFADDVSFHRIVEWCLEIARERRVREALQPGRARAHLTALRPDHVRRRARRASYRLMDALYVKALYIRVARHRRS